jgi:uncharacterized protein (DUF433 family)
MIVAVFGILEQRRWRTAAEAMSEPDSTGRPATDAVRYGPVRMLEFIMETLDRITQNPAVMGGKPCIRGMRVTVGALVGQIGAGRSFEALLADYPYLEREDIAQALRYAAWRAEEREVQLAAA